MTREEKQESLKRAKVKRELKKYKESFEINEYYWKAFYEFLHELDKIPDQSNKKRYLRENFERGNSCFRTLISFFTKRILFKEQCLLKYLVIDNGIDTSKRINRSIISLPQIDYCAEKERDFPELREIIQDFLQDFSVEIQELLCKYFECTNVFGILKDELKHLYESKDMTKYSEPDYRKVPLESYLMKGVIPSILNKRYRKPVDKLITLPKKKEYNMVGSTPEPPNVGGRPRQVRESKMTYAQKKDIEELNSVEKRKGTGLKFPCVVFDRTHSEGFMLYFFKSYGTIRTNMKGLMLENMKSVLLPVNSVSIVGFLRSSLILDIYVCSYNSRLAFDSVLDKVWSSNVRRKSLIKDLNSVQTLFEKFNERYPLAKTFRVNAFKGLFLSSLHGYLNYLLVNKSTKVVALFRNCVISTSKVKMYRCILENISVRANNGSKYLELKNIMTKEEYKVNINKASEEYEVCKDYLNKEVFVVDIEDRKYVLIKRLKKLSWTYEEFYKHDYKIIDKRINNGTWLKKSIRDM